MLTEDPPLILGGTALAQALLPGRADVLARGLRLQEMMRSAIDHLRPEGELDLGDRQWWPYLIHAGEYVERRDRNAIRDVLVISGSTYTRAKYRGLVRITDFLFRIDSGREALLRQLIGDNVVGAMDALRVAVKRYARNPHSPQRQEALMQALENVMAEQVNHLYSVCGTLVVGPIERMQERLDALEGSRERAVGE